MSGQSNLFDGLGFYVHPIVEEHIINSPIGKAITSRQSIIYPLPSLDQVQIIVIPLMPFSGPMSKGLIPLDPNFVWLDPDTLNDTRSWTPELLVRYFEDTIRKGEVIEGRKVVVGYGWVEKCLKAGRVLGSEDDWDGWRVRPAFHVVRHSRPYLQQTYTSESQPPVLQPILSRALPSGTNIPILELIASETAKDYTTRQSNLKKYSESQPPYYPKERYHPYPTPSGASLTNERARPLQPLLTLDKPLHHRKRGNKTPIIVPSQKIIKARYSVRTGSNLQLQMPILQPTSMVGLSKPTWWDMSRSRTINIPNTPTQWQMAMNQNGKVERREANSSGTVTSVDTHTQAQTKILEKENEMSERPKHLLDTRAVLATQPLQGEKCQAQTKFIFIDSHGKPMKMYLAPNIHPVYQEKIKTKGGQLCTRLHASIAIFYRTATDPSPLMPTSIAENEAGWNCGKKGQVTVTLDWLKVCLEKGKLIDTKGYQIVFQKSTRNEGYSAYTTLSSKKRKVVPFTAHSQVTVPSSRKPITDFSSQAESAATSRMKSTSILSQSSSFPSCPSLTEYDSISWQVEKIARRLYQNGRTGRLATLSDPDANGSGKDVGTNDYLKRYESIIQDRVMELADQYERAGATVQNNKTKNVPISMSAPVLIPSISSSDSSSIRKSRTEVQMKPGIANMQDHALDSGELQVTCSLVDRLLTRKMEIGDGNEDEEMRNLMDEELKGLDEFFDFGGDTPRTVDTSTPTDRLETKAETTSSSSLSIKRVLTSEDRYDAGVGSQMVEPASHSDESDDSINVDANIRMGKDEGKELEDELDQYHLFFQSLLHGPYLLPTPTRDEDTSPSIGEVRSKDDNLVDREDSDEEIPLRVVQASRAGARG
ncbi:hypothetical protein I204_01490 [Kwoniella mangroviensis CBS 8886]|nr:hypothetical protein I204_01490 [Kwoniella mangroviensis CBS 8886]